MSNAPQNYKIKIVIYFGSVAFFQVQVPDVQVRVQAGTHPEVFFRGGFDFEDPLLGFYLFRSDFSNVMPLTFVKCQYIDN